jgi:hypothetical protein
MDFSQQIIIKLQIQNLMQIRSAGADFENAESQEERHAAIGRSPKKKLTI